MGTCVAYMCGHQKIGLNEGILRMVFRSTQAAWVMSYKGFKVVLDLRCVAFDLCSGGKYLRSRVIPVDINFSFFLSPISCLYVHSSQSYGYHKFSIEMEAHRYLD